MLGLVLFDQVFFGVELRTFELAADQFERAGFVGLLEFLGFGLQPDDALLGVRFQAVFVEEAAVYGRGCRVLFGGDDVS